MSAGSKWIKGTEPQQPVSQAARSALAVRLGRVLHYLPRAAEEWEKDPENVHQLRVATRRAAATVDAFGDLLSAKRYKKMHKRLSHIRKAAGDARDCDVMLARFRREAEDDPAAADLVKELQQKRRDAQRSLTERVERLDKKGFADKVQELVHRVRFRRDDEAEPSLAEAARRRMRSVLDDFWLAAAGDLSQPAELHQLRIAAKGLRYSMEIFAGALPNVLREEIYPNVEAVQETLGAVNDHATAAERFREWAADGEHARFTDYFQRLAAEEDAATARCRDEFFDLWTPARQAQLHDTFEEVLAAGTNPTPALSTAAATSQVRAVPATFAASGASPASSASAMLSADAT